MTRLRLKYVDHFTDRNGHLRYYFRRPGGVRTPLPGSPGSGEFMAAYQGALNEAPTKKPKERGAHGTFDRLLQLYFESPEFLRLKAPTQRAYRLAMERLLKLENIGHRKVNEMRREHVKRILAKRVDRPCAANDALKKLRILIRFAMDLDPPWRRDDPTIKIKKQAEGEHHTWTDEEISAFEARWRVGSQQRTAFALHLYTGQRTSDVVRMSWRDVDEAGAIQVVQQKTGAKLWIPLHPDLRAILSAWPKSHIAILTTAFGKPFSVKGLGNRMADAIDAAGLPERCVTHGLRKAAGRCLAEAGCSEKEIAAVTGHASLEEVARYTKAANQKKLAIAAIGKMRGSNPGPEGWEKSKNDE